MFSSPLQRLILLLAASQYWIMEHQMVMREESKIPYLPTTFSYLK